MAVLSKNLRSMKENAIIAALPTITKYSYNNIVIVLCLYRYLDCMVGSSVLQKKEGRKSVSEQARLASL